MIKEELINSLKGTIKTKQELLECLQALKTTLDHVNDREEIHLVADRLLLEYINDEEVNKIYNSIDKWYS